MTYICLSSHFGSLETSITGIVFQGKDWFHPYIANQHQAIIPVKSRTSPIPSSMTLVILKWFIQFVLLPLPGWISVSGIICNEYLSGWILSFLLVHRQDRVTPTATFFIINLSIWALLPNPNTEMPKSAKNLPAATSPCGIHSGLEKQANKTNAGNHTAVI